MPFRPPNVAFIIVGTYWTEPCSAADAKRWAAVDVLLIAIKKGVGPVRESSQYSFQAQMVRDAACKRTTGE